MICKEKHIITVTLLFLFLLTACKNKVIEQPEIVRDFQQITNSGEINVLTLSGSMSYFIYKGQEMGYEYELLKNFAEENNLKVNLIIAENEVALVEKLEQGVGDLIACNVPITNQGKENFIYCGRETINEQVLVQRSNKGDTILQDIPELIGKDVWVISDSKYHHRLVNLNNESGGGINIRLIEQDTISTEDLIEKVSQGEIPYTVSDLDLAKLNKTYYSNINIELKVSHPQRSAWLVRKNSPNLAAALNQWFYINSNTLKHQSITKRYFEKSKLPGDEPVPIIGPNNISPFDNYFKKYASQIDWDWRLLASIAFQESKFHTDKVSWAGATGLMGLMPKTARAFGLTPEEMTDPEASIRGATQLIKRLNKAFSSIEDKNERIKFIVASYNAGAGHIYDAQALAKKYGKSPTVWEGNVEECLKLKRLPEYYNDPVCKQGYFRGSETLHYVPAVIERWQYYQSNIEH